MSETTTNATWFTRESFDRLTAELEGLRGERAAEIAQKISEARDEGDLKENGGYHAAKEEQGKMEARARQLEALLRDATVDAVADDGVVKPGMVVVAEINGNEMEFLYAHRENEAGDLTVYSDTSPLGAAILGLEAGGTTDFDAPNGKKMPVKVVGAKPFTG